MGTTFSSVPTEYARSRAGCAGRGRNDDSCIALKAYLSVDFHPSGMLNGMKIF